MIVRERWNEAWFDLLEDAHATIAANWALCQRLYSFKDTEWDSDGLLLHYYFIELLKEAFDFRNFGLEAIFWTLSEEPFCIFSKLGFIRECARILWHFKLLPQVVCHSLQEQEGAIGVQVGVKGRFTLCTL